MVQNRRHRHDRRGRIPAHHGSQERIVQDFRRQIHRAAADRASDQGFTFCEPGGVDWQRAQVSRGLDGAGLGALESYAQLKGIKAKSHAELCRHPRIIDLFERQIAGLTPDLAQYERVKKVALLENEFTIEGGELTPTLKVKRRVVDEKYRDVIDALYADV